MNPAKSVVTLYCAIKDGIWRQTHTIKPAQELIGTLQEFSSLLFFTQLSWFLILNFEDISEADKHNLMGVLFSYKLF